MNDEATILADSLRTAHVKKLKRLTEKEEKKMAEARASAVAQLIADL